MNFIKLSHILLIFLLFSSCGTEKFVEPEYLNPPSDLIVYPKNNKIKVKFYSSNSEDKFDGFNIYISTSSPLKNQTGLLPVKNPTAGSIPTINKTSKEIDPNTPIEIIIERDADDNSIENGITYYVAVKAHSIRNYKSQPSNEASATPRIDNLDGVTIYANEGFNFKTLKKSAPYDFIFTINNSRPYITAQNNCVIQSKGYQENWEMINTVNEKAFEDLTVVPFQIENGHVLLIRTDDNRYGKIQIKEINTGANQYIKIIWAFQQNYNNMDI